MQNKNFNNPRIVFYVGIDKVPEHVRERDSPCSLEGKGSKEAEGSSEIESSEHRWRVGKVGEVGPYSSERPRLPVRSRLGRCVVRSGGPSTLARQRERFVSVSLFIFSVAVRLSFQ